MPVPHPGGQNVGRPQVLEVGRSDNFIVTIKNRHDIPRDHPDFSANRYETFGPYTESQAKAVADRLVEVGYKVLIHQLELWPN